MQFSKDSVKTSWGGGLRSTAGSTDKRFNTVTTKNEILYNTLIPESYKYLKFIKTVYLLYSLMVNYSTTPPHKTSLI